MLPELELCFDRALTFADRGVPTRQRACVLVAACAAQLHVLNRSLGLAMRACGLHVRATSFTPRITLLYDFAVIDERRVESIHFPVREFFMVRSRIGTGQPYQLLG
jgi:RNA 2',3'-cyclic 3'-phosphodiesterase